MGGGGGVECFQMVLSRQTGTGGKTGDHFSQTCPHYLLGLLLCCAIFSFFLPISVLLPLVALLIFFSYLSLAISFSTSHLILLSSPFPRLSLAWLPCSPTSFCLSKQVLQCIGPTWGHSQHSACPPLPPIPQPPHSPKGKASDRALPSDYTGGAGLEYSPEGRQLSISDNCRDTHAHVCTHTHAGSLPFFPSCSVNQGAIT